MSLDSTSREDASEAPGEAPVEPLWPAAAPADHVAARLELAKAERALRDRVEEVAAARRALPPGPDLPDHELTDASVGRPEPVGGRVRLSELFGDHDTLTTYHLMFAPADDEACPMCSMWVDGFHGVAHHLRQRTAFAVIAAAPAEKLRDWAQRRGWDGLRLLSASGTTLTTDLNTERPDGAQRPAISVFSRTPAGIQHRYTEFANFLDGEERGIDLLSPVWNVLDLLPQGRGDWYADNAYAGRSRG